MYPGSQVDSKGAGAGVGTGIGVGASVILAAATEWVFFGAYQSGGRRMGNPMQRCCVYCPKNMRFVR